MSAIPTATLVGLLRALAALKRGQPLHDNSDAEAVWIGQAADELERLMLVEAMNAGPKTALALRQELGLTHEQVYTALVGMQAKGRAQVIVGNTRGQSEPLKQWRALGL